MNDFSIIIKFLFYVQVAAGIFIFSLEVKQVISLETFDQTSNKEPILTRYSN